MSDYKAIYTDISKDYIDIEVQANSIDWKRYNRSKERENLYNEGWIEHKVNLNEIIDKFVHNPSEIVEQHSEGGVKYDFEGKKYIVKCDKVSGYLRIYDKENRSYCTIDGTISKNPEETHFKIKKREEM